jgi:hypothetical protein
VGNNNKIVVVYKSRERSRQISRDENQEMRDEIQGIGWRTECVGRSDLRQVWFTGGEGGFEELDRGRD